VPTAEVVPQSGTPLPSGLQVEDRCLVGRIPSVPGTGQIFGNGVNIVVQADSLQTFTRALADAAPIACGSNPSPTEGQQLIARLNGVPGLRVVDYTWPGR